MADNTTREPTEPRQGSQRGGGGSTATGPGPGQRWAFERGPDEPPPQGKEHWTDKMARLQREEKERQEALREAMINRARQNAMPTSQLERDRNLLEEERRRAQHLHAPQTRGALLGQAERLGGDVGQVADSSFRQGQEGLASMLMAQARGEGPSLADAQLRSATDRNMSQLMAAQAAARGSGGGMALRGLRDAQASANQQMAGQSAQLRLQEQLQAQGLLGGVLQGARGQDLSRSTTQAQLDMQRGLANQAAGNQFALQQGAFEQQAQMGNLAAKVSTQALGEQLAQRYMQMGMSIDEATRRALMDVSAMELGQYDAAANRDAAAQAAANQANREMFGYGLGAFGLLSGFAFSDANLKTDIRPVTPSVPNVAALVPMEDDVDPVTGLDPETSAFLSRFGAGRRGADGGGVSAGATHAAATAIGAGAGALPGAMAAMSDRRAKEGDERRPSDVDGFLDALSAYTFRYKDPARDGEGRFLGLMAQDLERTELGRGMVHETPVGKVIDPGKMANAAMATAVELHRRQKDLESRLPKRKGDK